VAVVVARLLVLASLAGWATWSAGGAALALER
jgi:hypothetical protein